MDTLTGSIRLLKQLFYPDRVVVADPSASDCSFPQKFTISKLTGP
jgi:hypothetical protein